MGNSPGQGSVSLVANGPWTATSNTSWLTVSPGSQAGTGNAVIDFSYGPNFSTDARTGTLIIACQTSDLRRCQSI